MKLFRYHLVLTIFVIQINRCVCVYLASLCVFFAIRFWLIVNWNGKFRFLTYAFHNQYFCFAKNTHTKNKSKTWSNVWNMRHVKWWSKIYNKKWVRWICIEVYVLGFGFEFVCVHYKYNRIGIFRIEETITIFTKAVPKKSKYKLNEDI